MNLGTRRLTDVIVLLVIVCVLAFWSARLFTEWGTDYGVLAPLLHHSIRDL